MVPHEEILAYLAEVEPFVAAPVISSWLSPYPIVFYLVLRRLRLQERVGTCDGYNGD